MDHIKSYFTGLTKKLIDKKIEKEKICLAIFETTGIELDMKEVSLKNFVVKIKVFGAKRTKIISSKQKVLESLKDKGLIVVDLK